MRLLGAAHLYSQIDLVLLTKTHITCYFHDFTKKYDRDGWTDRRPDGHTHLCIEMRSRILKRNDSEERHVMKPYAEGEELLVSEQYVDK